MSHTFGVFADKGEGYGQYRKEDALKVFCREWLALTWIENTPHQGSLVVRRMGLLGR